MIPICSWIHKKARSLLPPKLKVFENMEEVQEMARCQGKILIVYNDDIYDVTTYLDNHPGGKEILHLSNAKIVDKVFDKYHYPKGDAPKIMKKFKIGSLRPDWHIPRDTEASRSEETSQGMEQKSANL